MLDDGCFVYRNPVWGVYRKPIHPVDRRSVQWVYRFPVQGMYREPVQLKSEVGSRKSELPRSEGYTYPGG